MIRSVGVLYIIPSAFSKLVETYHGRCTLNESRLTARTRRRLFAVNIIIVINRLSCTWPRHAFTRDVSRQTNAIISRNIIGLVRHDAANIVHSRSRRSRKVGEKKLVFAIEKKLSPDSLYTKYDIVLKMTWFVFFPKKFHCM